MNYTQTLEFLFSSLPVFEAKGATAYKPGLERITAFCRHIGNPQRNFFTIHVAGTNGKGSVSHIIASVLQQAGYRRRDDLPRPFFLTADRQHHRKIGCDELGVEPGGLVLFIDQRDGRTTRAALSQLQVLPGRALRAVENGEDKPRLVQLLPAAANTFGFDLVFRLTQTGSVEEIQPDVPQLDSLLHHVAGGSGHRRDDGPVESGQQVEQGGLARIGLAHDGTVHALAEDSACIVALDEGVQLLLYPA